MESRARPVTRYSSWIFLTHAGREGSWIPLQPRHILLSSLNSTLFISCHYSDPALAGGLFIRANVSLTIQPSSLIRIPRTRDFQHFKRHFEEVNMFAVNSFCPDRQEEGNYLAQTRGLRVRNNTRFRQIRFARRRRLSRWLVNFISLVYNWHQTVFIVLYLSYYVRGHVIILNFRMRRDARCRHKCKSTHRAHSYNANSVCRNVGITFTLSARTTI